MSIASELNWTTAAKPKFGKSTEHSGAKKGKGAWDKKKVAKKTSNKGRRAGGKQEIKDQTTSDESDGPFPGAAPLFKKAAAMHWATAEPRPCYPSEEPVKDHCNDGISPPAPGGGDDMAITPEDEQQWQREADEEEDQQLQWEDEQMRPQLGDPDYVDPMGGEDEWTELDDLQDPMETAPPADAPLAPEPTPAPGPLQSDPHGARDPSLGPDAPHQFWSQEQPHIQDALNKYLIPQLDSPKPGVADKARRILMEGPHAE